MKKQFIIYILLLFAIYANGQSGKITIKGVVKDATTGIVMPKATINVNYGQKIVISDADGNFSFEAKPGEIVITARYLNYLPYRVKLDGRIDESITINLIEISSELDQVTVTSKSADQNIKKPIMGVATMSMNNLKKIPTVLGEVDVFRGLQMLPGVTSVGEASNGVNIRGGTTDQNLILLDGAPLFNATHMFGLFSAFPSDAISSFDLYKGNVPSRFGGRTAGVVDVVMSNPTTSKFKSQVSIGIVSTKLMLDIPLIKDKMGVMVTGRVSANDWLLPLVSEKLDDIKAKFADGSIKFFYNINPKNTLTLSTYGSYDFLQTNILGTINNINSTSNQFDYRSLNFSSKWFHAFNDNLNLQTSFVSSGYVPQTLLPELNSKNKVSIYQDVKFNQVKFNLNYYKGKHKIEVGTDATRYTINPGELKPGTSQAVLSLKTPIENGTELGFFAEDEIEISKKITLSAGLRYSYYATFGGNYKIYDPNQEKLFNTIIDSISFAKNKISKSYGGFEPRVGVNFTTSPSSSIKLGVNSMRQYLQVISNTTTPIPTSRWKSSDRFIKPQVSLLYSVGYFKNLSENNYEISTEVYYKTTNNIIDYKPGASFLLNKNIETELLQGKNKSYGLEMMIAKKKGELTGWINYTYARSLNQVNEGEVATQNVNFGEWYNTNYDRPHTLNMAMVINQTKTHDFSFNFTYSTGRPFTTPKAYVESNGVQYPFYTLRNNSRIPSYHRLDFSWNIYNPKNLNKKYKGNWNFTIYNLYGRKNAYSVFIRNEGRVSKAYQLTIFGAPIPSLSYNFKIE